MQSSRSFLASSRSFLSRTVKHRTITCGGPAKPSSMSKDEAAIVAKPYLDKLFKGDRSTLARCITMVESMREDKRAEGHAVLAGVMQHMAIITDADDVSKHTFRVGLSGPPGAGKSTFIEALGCRLIGRLPWKGVVPMDFENESLKKSANRKKFGKEKVAVLAVDPSSSTTGGSLLADKTRMTLLSREPNAFIRPSPNAGHLGGVARATNETVVLCEGCGYTTVLVETVGVGQAEFKVADMVDMFVLVLPPAGGDELQGMKRGIVEVADLIVINKADGDLLPAARRIAMEYSSGLHYMRHRRKKWVPKVLMLSSQTGNGVAEFWDAAKEFQKAITETGEYRQNRKNQLKTWMWGYLNEGVMSSFKNHEAIRKDLKHYEDMVVQGVISPGEAAERLLALFLL